MRKVWSTETQPQTGTPALLDTDVLAGSRGLTFWRPQPPVGYAVLGDCVTAGTAYQPTFQVWPVDPPPLGFPRTYHPTGDQNTLEPLPTYSCQDCCMSLLVTIRAQHDPRVRMAAGGGHRRQ